ncbi:MAG: hypothetical protein AB9856_03725 [Cellulosilyticaceae bacterium]
MASKIKVSVTMPSTLEGMKALQDRIDTVYAENVMKILNKLDCSYETKVALLERVMNAPDNNDSTLDRFLREHPELADVG